MARQYHPAALRGLSLLQNQHQHHYRLLRNPIRMSTGSSQKRRGTTAKPTAATAHRVNCWRAPCCAPLTVPTLLSPLWQTERHTPLSAPLCAQHSPSEPEHEAASEQATGLNVPLVQTWPQTPSGARAPALLSQLQHCIFILLAQSDDFVHAVREKPPKAHTCPQTPTPSLPKLASQLQQVWPDAQSPFLSQAVGS